MSKTVFSPIKRTRSAIDAMSIRNGQLLVSTDTGECFVDTNNSRIQIGDVVHVADELSLPLVPVAKIYFSEEDLCFFYPTYEDGDLVWRRIGGNDTPAQETNFYISVTGEELTISQTESPNSSAVTGISVVGETLTFNEGL